MINGQTTTAARTTWASHIDETKRGLAKLLARENITVRHDAVKTAAFNLETRTLILPKWENITVDQYDLLIGHEVAHAKYSDDLDALNAEDMTPGLHSFINVLEDTRIERKIKEEFPGLRGSFRRGYADFFLNGPIFNDIKTTEDAAKHSFIDRVNIHYKIGAHVQVPFTADEQRILSRIDNLRSMSDAVALARELYAAAKEQKQQQQQQQQDAANEPQQGRESDNNETSQSQTANQSEEQSDEQSNESNESQDSSESNESNESKESKESQDSSESQSNTGAADATESQDSSESQPSQDNGAADAEPSASTDQTNSEALETLAATEKRRYPYGFDEPKQFTLGVLPTQAARDMTVTVADALEQFDRYCARFSALPAIADCYLREFQTAQGKTINHLATEFERKKVAALHEKARTSRTGVIDCTKLHAYKFRDDLFKSITVLPNGKNHGVVVLVDGSSSMVDMLSDTLDQLLVFALFAKRVNIPFQAFIFGLSGARIEQYNSDALAFCTRWKVADSQLVPTDFKLVQILDSTAPRWNDQLRFVAAFAARYDSDFFRKQATVFGESIINALYGVPYTQLGLTPIVSALILAEYYVGALKQSRKLDKMSLIVLTDGENNGHLTYLTTAAGKRTVEGTYDSTCHVLRDTVTRTTYAHMTESVNGMRPNENAPIAELVDCIRKRHDCRVIGIKIVKAGTRQRASNEVMRNHGKSFVVPERLTVETRYMPWTKSERRLVDTWTESGQYTFAADETFFDCAVLVSAKRLALASKTDDFSSLDTTKMTDRMIIKTFKSAATNAVANRLFVNAVVPFLA